MYITVMTSERKGTSFKCLVVLALKHLLGTLKLKLKINTNQFKCWFLRRGETEEPGENPLVAE